LLSEFREDHLPKQIEPKGHIFATIGDASANVMNPGLPKFARNLLDAGYESGKKSQRLVAQACRLGFCVGVPGFGQIVGHGSLRNVTEMAIFSTTGSLLAKSPPRKRCGNSFQGDFTPQPYRVLQVWRSPAVANSAVRVTCDWQGSRGALSVQTDS
jgi:hypothetical protein